MTRQKNSQQPKLIWLFSLSIIFSCLVFWPGQGFSEPTISFEHEVYDPIDRPVIITVVDPSANLDPGIRDAITISVTSTSDPQGISLVLQETDIDTGEFKNTDLVLMDGDNLPTINDKVTAFVDGFDFDSGSIETWLNPLIVFSTPTDEDGLFLLMTETRADSGRYEEQFAFTSDASHDNLLSAKPGDIFSVSFDCGLRQASVGLILPNLDLTLGAIRAPLGDTITATYQGQSSTATVENTRGCGGSGGGLVINRVVLDVLAGGTSGGDFMPPQIIMPKLNLSDLSLVSDFLDLIQNADPFTPIPSVDDTSIDYPLQINENRYLLTQFANTIETYQGKTGQPISFKINLSDATGIQHIGLYTNLRGDYREVSDSDTYLVYNKGSPLDITDLNGLFSNVTFSQSKDNGKYLAEFNMTFAKSMDTSDVVIRTWDDLKNSGDIKIFDAIKIEGKPLVNPDVNNLIVPNSEELVVPYYKMPKYEIPEADLEGNLVYYNSFGGLEENKVHPVSSPIVYPGYIGKDERHDDGFNESVNSEQTRAQIVAEKLIGNPFSNSKDSPMEKKFFYPSKVGKLDRENKDLLKDLLLKENLKAYEISSKKYHTNLVQD